MRCPRAAVLVLVTTLAAAAQAPAQDAPPPQAGQPAVPSWPLKGALSMAASPDGAWIGVTGFDSTLLFPTAGGEPVDLRLDKQEGTPGACAFSADAKWFVVPGAADSVETSAGADRTQTVYVFPTKPPFQARKVQVKLLVRELPKEIRKRLSSPVKQLKGAAQRFIPLDGSRMLVHRDGEDPQVWDLAKGARAAAPPALGERWNCGVSGDGTRSVLVVDDGLEVRDVKTNRVLQKLRDAEPRPDDTFVTKPRLSPDLAAVVFLVRTGDPGAHEQDHAVQCRSAADGVVRWNVSLGKVSYVTDVHVTAHHVLLELPAGIRLLALADGAAAEPVLAKRATIRSACPTSDRRGLWAVVDDALTRVELPAPE